MPLPRSERDLVRAARSGDGPARAEIVRRFGRVAWRAAWGVTGRRELADEATQDGLLRALDGLGTFDDSRPFAPWLYRIVTNAALRVVEREERARAVPVGRGSVLRSGVDFADGGDAIRRAVLELPDDQREIVVLRYWADLGIDQIAGVLSIPVGTVGSRLSRALARLRDVLGEEEGR